MNISFKEGKTSKSIRMAFLGIGISTFFLFGGILLGENMVGSLNNLNSGSASPPAKDVAAPVISSMEVSEITNSTAVIRWETDRATDRQVDYGISEIYEFASELEIRPDTNHEVFLVNLEPGLTYHFRVRSRDPVGNLAFSEDDTFTTLAGQRGQVSICGWDGDSIERVDTFCPSEDGWAKGESWTEFCSAVWNQTISVPVDDCFYQFSDVKAQKSSVSSNEYFKVLLKPSYTGWIDILEVDSPSGKDKFFPAAKYAVRGQVTMDGMEVAGKYTFRFRPADDSAVWSDLLTITVRR